MRNSVVLLMACLMCQNSIIGQMLCGGKEGLSTKGGTGFVANGGTFAPRGDMRALVVFVSFGETYDTMSVDGWPAESDFPDWALGNTRRSFYTDTSEFSPEIYSDSNRYSVSNFYYQMSQGTFRLMADFYPHRVVVDVSRTDGWGDIHRKVIAQIADSVDWSLYDNRKNGPDYKFNVCMFTPSLWTDRLLIPNA